MHKILTLLLCLLSFSALAQYQVGTEELSSTAPDDVMPPGKIAVDRTTMPPRLSARSDAQLIKQSCTGPAPINTGNCTDNVNTPLIETTATGVTANGGQFRIACDFSHVAFDDPIIWPGVTGRTHLHQFFGNDTTAANSDTALFSTVGKSTCNGGLLNRSAYWFPVLVYHCESAGDIAGTTPGLSSGCNPLRNGEIKVATLQPANFYYKSQASHTDPMDSQTSSYGGLPMQWPPPGFAMITGCTVGASCLTPLSIAGSHFIDCYHNDSVQGSFPNYRFDHLPSSAQAVAIVGGDGNGCDEIRFNIQFPRCWNGVDLTTATGKGHINSNASSTACTDVGHIMFPSIALNIYYEVDNVDLDFWRLSSDLPRAEAITAGCTSASNYCAAYTSHADWVNGWDQTNNITGLTGGDWGMTVIDAIMDQCYHINNAGSPLSSDCHNDLLGSPLGDNYWWKVYR
jgi:hypothetical protein